VRKLNLLVFLFVGISCNHSITAPSMTTSPTTFSGYRWQIKSSLTSLVPPGPNLWSDSLDNIWTDDQARLHLKILNKNGKWYSSELVGLASFGFGTYRIYVDSSIDGLDPNAVLGFFVWGTDPAYNHREIDIEFTVWSNPLGKNGWYTIQTHPEQTFGFNIPHGVGQTVHSFTWKPGILTSQSSRADGTIIAQHSFSQDIAVPGDETPRLNLWLIKGQPPANNQPLEVVINRFEFTP
jgi:hypothetical protein